MDPLLDKLKSRIIATLKLTDLTPGDIDVDAPLIGEGLGLDSIDTLELLVLLEKEYGVTVPDITVGRKIFSSVRAMGDYITQEQKRVQE